VFSAVIASALECSSSTERVLSLGHAGGGFGSKILVIGVTGRRSSGGIVGFFLGRSSSRASKPHSHHLHLGFHPISTRAARETFLLG